jgi:hypothetical protein
MTDKFVKGATTSGTSGGNHSITRTIEISAHELSKAEVPVHTHGINYEYLNHQHEIGSMMRNWGPGNILACRTDPPDSCHNMDAPTAHPTNGAFYGGDPNRIIPGPLSHVDFNGAQNNRTGPGSGGNHANISGVRDPRRPDTENAGNALGISGNGRAYQHHHPIKISGTGQSDSGSIDTNTYDNGNSQSATMTWDNQPEWVGLVFIMKL